ncbi:hypothetical protein EfmGK961_28770 (plasmid) [Enterococcus faecium]|nr:hypothetical protein EfmGK961_28770 [Enterococcus faecium]
MKKIIYSTDNLNKHTLRRRMLELLRETPTDLLKKIDLDEYNFTRSRDRMVVQMMI